VRAVEQRRLPGRALDLGCGEGVATVYLAAHDYTVVGVDFVPGALELARTRAVAAGVAPDLQCSDVLDYESPDGFDLVLDSGCLHHLPPKRVAAYREKLDRWLLPSGDYVLVHFGKRHALDWRPLGPRRVRRDHILRIFSPLRLEAYEETHFHLPLPLGPVALAGVYWFRK
jgi:cyclopropane fatty-acyl-phospholipid synthase-like methyltransferase